MRSHAKAESAGPILARGKSLSFPRRALAIRGASTGFDGRGAPSARRALLLTLAALALSLLCAPAALADGTVNISFAGSGSGTITSTATQPFFGTPSATPGQINCKKASGPVCSASFSNTSGFGFDVTVILTASADPGGGPFVGWAQSGATSSQRCTIPPGNPATCEITLGSSNPTVTVFAVFGAPPDPPVVSTDSAGSAGHLRSLEGRVNPNGLGVLDCHFAYGETTEYGQSTPCAQSPASLGSGNADQPVSALTAPLEPNTTYHFRLRASNLGGVGQGKDRTFTTGPAPADSCPNAGIRAEQGIEVLLLPNCMALEQVSPPVKRNQHARLTGGGVSVNGDRVIFNSPASLPNSGPNRNGLGGDLFIATRDSAGWATEGQSPPVEVSGAISGPSFTPDFSRWFWGARNGYYQQGVGGFLAQITPPLKNFSITEEFGPVFLAASFDHSRVFVRPGSEEGTYAPGDPKPAGTGEDENVYLGEFESPDQPSLELLARDRDGKVWGARCGVRIGGIEETSGQDLYLRNGHRNQGAISPDGGRILFSTRPDQPEVGTCTAASKMRIMVREETPTGPQIEELIDNECDRVSPPCSTHVGEEIYQGASVDQTKVYFTTNRQLADTDLDGTAASCNNENAVTGCDLYVYDAAKPEGERLTQVSAGESTAVTPGQGAKVANSITAISADGSHVYFVALSVLTTDPNPLGVIAQTGGKNLYSYTHSTGELAFIGKLHNQDGGGPFPEFALYGARATWSNDAYPVPITGTDPQGNEVGGDGHILVFRAKAALTVDDTDTARDIYRYDADAETLEHVSNAGPGGSGNASIDVETAIGGAQGTDYAERGRWVSEDGETIVFTTSEALLPGDLNGKEDSYMWRGGELYHLPGSVRASSTLRQSLPMLSHDGSTVAYHTTEQLLPSDGDSVQDVYVLRVNGGYPTPVRAICEGEACQGAPSTLSDEIGAATATVAGAGNASSQGNPPRRRCPKGKRRVRRSGKSRCVTTRANDRKRTSRKQGGQK